MADPAAAALQPDSPLSTAASRIESIADRDQRAYDQEQKTLAPMRERLSRTLESIPQQPKQEKVQAPPSPDDYHKNSLAFASAMAILGAVSSRFTRNAGNASLNAFAGALNGWQQGNMQAYEDAAKHWEQATKQTLDNNKMVMDKYKAILENRQLNIEAQMQQIQLVAAQFHDQITMDAAAAKNYTMIADLYDKNQKNTLKLQESFDKLQNQREQQRIKNEKDATYWLSPDGQARLELPEGQPGALSAQQKAGVKQLIDIYGQKVKQPSAQNIALQRYLEEHPNATAEQIQQFNAQGRPQRSAPAMFISKFMQENPDAGSADIQKAAAIYSETQARARTLGNRGANVDVAVDEAIGAAQQALARSSEVPRGNWVPVSQLSQAAQRAGSNPALKRFSIANAGLITAYSQTMSRTGTNTVTAQKRAEELLLTADGPEAYRAGVEQLITEMNIVKQAIKDVAAGGGGGGGATAAPASDEGWGSLTVH